MTPPSDNVCFDRYEDYIKYQVHHLVQPKDNSYYDGVIRSHLNAIKSYLEHLRPSVSIMVCGCGNGYGLRVLKQFGFTNVIGMDISKKRLDTAIEVGYPLLRLDMHSMKPIKDAAFDVVYSSHCIEHGLYPNRILSEIHRILKPGGIFLAVLPYPIEIDELNANKAHCGAKDLKLSKNDSGASLVKVIKSYGFSFIRKGTASYRCKSEIFIKFVKGTVGPLVQDFGPLSTIAGTKFNVQSNGFSALWFIIEDPYNADIVVRFDGYFLKTARYREVLSALVPESLLRISRKVEILVFDIDRTQRRSKMWFDIQEKPGIQGERIVKTTEKRVIKPNLFIIGAPRSATTSLYWRLTTHPDIYMSRIKEPYYFDKRAHGLINGAVSKEKDYLKLFEFAPFQAKYMGEASVTYLSSTEALKRIYAFNRNSKIIIMLRNPVEASISMYLRARQGGKHEKASEFEKAWRQANSLNRPFFTNYPEIFLIGDQLKNAANIFGIKNIKVILYDDLVKNSRAVFQDLMDFLQLQIDSNMPICKENSANWNNNKNYASLNLQREMNDYFQPQIKIVSDFIKRNLDHWLK